MADQSARQVTGAGPRHAFIFSGVSSPVIDNVLGVDITVARSATGKYTVTHNLGKTGYCGIFTVEDNGAAGIPLIARMTGRSGNTCDIWIEDDAGTLTNADYVHGVFYD